VAYDPGWPEAYSLEAAALHEVFGTALQSIHHVGSTSVPGLMAKPVIDILVVLDDTTDMGRFDQGMMSLGYRVRGECLDAGGTPGRFHFSKPEQGQRTHHVHACAEGHFQIAEMVLFPRYLAECPEVAAEYTGLKRRALAESSHDSVGYMAGKHDWIRAALRDALAYFGEPDQSSALQAREP
jgi:GrpB-like predicted nucleotidyltransferase (UPF0157 family)